VTEIPTGLAAALADRYRIVRPLGQGGMATVYLADDLKHHRQVAVKVMRSEVSAMLGPERFLQEIQTTAGLRHPNILPLYDSGAAAGLLYYVMPLVEGESLRERLRWEKRLPVREAVRIAAEVADALAYAHGRGVIHRDIKPENILLERGHAVVADFGIALLVRGGDATHLTQPGMAMGTVAYMSPEQAAADAPIDGRSDLYALGCVLYEMLAGQPPFTGPTAESVARQHLAAAPPPITERRPEVPPPVAAALGRALAKDPADRYATAAEFMAALTAPAPAAPRRAERSRPLPVLAAVAVLAAGLAAWWVRREEGAGLRGPVPVTLKQVTFSKAVEEYPALSPDGRRLVFSRDVAGLRQLFLRELPDGTERPLTSGDFDNIQATWTPDGRAVLFVRASAPRTRLQPRDVFGEFSGGDVWRRDVDGGGEERLVEDAYNPAAAPDGKRIAFDAPREGTRRIWVADDHGRNAQQVSLDSSEAVAHLVPRWSPDGRRIAFQEVEHTRFDIRTVDVATRASAAVTDDAFQDINPVWDASGRAVLFSSSRAGGMNVWRVPVGADGRPTGPPEQITTGAGQDVQLSAPARDGRLAFTVLQLNADLWRLPVDPATGRPRGASEPVVATTREDSRGSWSPDGSLVAFNSDRAGDMNIWVHSMADGTDRQITRGPGGDYQPRWSPDGRRIAFFSARGGNADIWIVELADGRLTRLTTSPWLDINPVFSPDGKRIAFQSDRQGRMEVWTMNADGTAQRQLSTVGSIGHFEVWARDGRSLLFHPSSGGIPAARIEVADGRMTPLQLRGGNHMSFGPGEGLVADVVEHRQIWVSPMDGAPYQVFAFDDPDIRIDYPIWSPDGRWLLFDRLKPEGGDIWLLEQGAAGPGAR
jgi:serine/threonine-protein kinase